VLGSGDQISVVVRSLLANPDFQQLVAERAVVLLRNGLADGVALDVIEECIAQLDGEISRELKRWNNTEQQWQVSKRAMRANFTGERTRLFIDLVSSTLHLTTERKQEVFGEFLDRLG
jgi:hypothetical protein